MDSGNILPMYEEVRRKIYFSFQEMKKQNSLLQSSMNKTQVKFRLVIFREKYLNFIYEVNTDKKINKIDQKKKDFLLCFIDKPYTINSKEANLIVLYSSELLEILGITNIQYQKIERIPLG